MVTWGPDFADYAIAVCCMGWLAPAVYQAVRDVRYLLRRKRRGRHRGLRTLRNVGAPIGGARPAPPYSKASPGSPSGVSG